MEFPFRLRPVVDLVEKSLNVDGDKSASTTMADHRQVLTICLLQNLLSRYHFYLKLLFITDSTN